MRESECAVSWCSRRALPRSDEAGARDEAEIVSIAHRHGMRVLGPASMGVISTVPDVSMHASFAPVTLIPGRVAFSSQSGPLGVALLEQAHRAGVGISHFVALGNKADVSTNDFLQYWESDESTSVMALHIAIVRQPAEVHPARATGLEDQADRRGEDGWRRRRSHRRRAVPSDGCDPGGRDRRAVRRGPRARQPAAATGRSRRGDQQRLRGEIARGGGADPLRSAHGRAQRRHP